MKACRETVKNIIGTVCCLLIILSLFISCLKKQNKETPLGTALQIAESIEDDHTKGRVLSAIAAQYAAVGADHQANKVMQMITDPSDKDIVLLSMAVAHLENEQYGKALSAAEEMEDSGSKIQTLCLTVTEYAKHGYHDQASVVLLRCFEIAKKIEDDLDQAQALARIATAYVDIGKTEETVRLLNQALQIVESTADTSHSWRKRDVLIDIARGYAKLGRKDIASGVLDQAQQMILAIEGENNEYFKAMELFYIANAFTEFGQCEEALKISELIADVGLRGRILEAVAAKYAEDSKYDRALQVSRIIEHVGYRNVAVEKLVYQYAKEGHYDKALELTETIDAGDKKADALVSLSLLYTKEGQDSIAFELLSQAHKLADLVTDPYSKAVTLIHVARGYAKIEQFDKVSEILFRAFQEARTIEDASSKSVALNVLVQTYAEFGQYTKALEIVKTIEEISNKIYALLMIDSAYHERDENPDDRAKQILREMREEISSKSGMFSYPVMFQAKWARSPIF